MSNAYAWFGLVAALGLVGCAESPRQAAEDVKGDLSHAGDGDDEDDSETPYPDENDNEGSNTGDGDGSDEGTGDGDGSEFSGGSSSVDAGAGDILGGLGGLFGGLGGGASDGGTANQADAGECESSPRVCWDVFDCYIFHPGDLACGYTKCEGFVCKK